jgi:hypothetical protein
LLDFTKNL